MDQADGHGENRLVAERRRKLEELRIGGNAFPNSFRRDSLADQLQAAYASRDGAALQSEDIPVSVAGRMMAKRVMGRNSFVKVQDRSGQIQLFVQRERLGEEAYEQFKKWDLGDIIGATGRLMKTKTDELSVAVDQAELLVKSLRPMPEKWHGIEDQEIRYRQRYLDLISNSSTRDTFARRSEVMKFLRAYLDAHEFVEVETPMMHPIPGGAAARPFRTFHNALDQTLFLRIAPELYLKRLLVGGFERVYELNRVFRNEGLSTRHNPEFTILELYQAYASYDEMMTLTENLIREVARNILGSTRVHYQDERFDFSDPFPRSSVEDLLRQRHPELLGPAVRDMGVLIDCCERAGIAVLPDYGAGKLQLELFEKTVEHELRAPTFVTHYAAEVSPLARASDADPFVTDRFELFIAGREMANGFSELNDPEEQAARFRAQLTARESGDDEAMRYDEDYIRALEYGMPPAAGLGVGVDRLVMLLTDAASIRDVLLFPQLKQET